MEFQKYEGLRNDFVVVDRRGSGPIEPERARAICDRRSGVGADGVLSVLAPESAGALATMHVTNADGSVPEMCGNGLRCVAIWLRDQGLVEAARFTVDTGAGPLEVRLEDGLVEVDMGPSRLESPACPEGELVGAEFALEGETARGTFVSMGNPHLVLETRADAALATRTAPALQASPRFPEGINVGYCALGPDGVDLVVYERGAGLTEACGTGACAAVAALVARGRVAAGTPVEVRLPGGPLTITWRPEGVLMRGPARRVFAGQLPEE